MAQPRDGDGGPVAVPVVVEEEEDALLGGVLPPEDDDGGGAAAADGALLLLRAIARCVEEGPALDAARAGDDDLKRLEAAVRELVASSPAPPPA